MGLGGRGRNEAMNQARKNHVYHQLYGLLANAKRYKKNTHRVHTERKDKPKGEEENLYIPPVERRAFGLLIDARGLVHAPPLAHASSVVPEVWGPYLRTFPPGRAVDFGNYGSVSTDWGDGKGIAFVMVGVTWTGVFPRMRGSDEVVFGGDRGTGGWAADFEGGAVSSVVRSRVP